MKVEAIQALTMTIRAIWLCGSLRYNITPVPVGLP